MPLLAPTDNAGKWRNTERVGHTVGCNIGKMDNMKEMTWAIAIDFLKPFLHVMDTQRLGAHSMKLPHELALVGG